MERQTPANLLGKAVVWGLLSALAMGIGHYCRYEAQGAIVHAVGVFTATIGWLLLVGAVAVMAVWVVRSCRA